MKSNEEIFSQKMIFARLSSPRERWTTIKISICVAINFNLVKTVLYKDRKKGSKEGRKEGRKDGRKEGRKKKIIVLWGTVIAPYSYHH